jgi:uncharacterized protein
MRNIGLGGMKGVIAGVAVAAVLWFVMFSPWTSQLFNFWYAMTFSAVVLTAVSLTLCRETLRELRPSVRQVALGLAIAFVLWWVFWIGDKVSQMLFSFARPQVDMIYSFGNGTDTTLIALLLLLIIGPAEEIFWRGFVQRRLMRRLGPNCGFLLATACYTLVHIWSFNFMLVMAALVVGFCWGLVYRFSPRNLMALVISHAVWDACAFVVFTF